MHEEKATISLTVVRVAAQTVAPTAVLIVVTGGLPIAAATDANESFTGVVQIGCTNGFWVHCVCRLLPRPKEFGM